MILENLTKKEILILTIGFTGQFLFFMRFFVQWIYSERRKKSLIPMAFWYLSIAGSLVLLVYALLRRDIVFIAGQGLGILIYLRNIYFISMEKKRS
ncbi:MAG: lipid-A-disaccharide synthase N-terminal domain-containing protein [Dissulfurimicrobium sp.]|uniref:lipid-A-disaccharide synthase N-terminal domain-containing protein n=1 Tax=Dissulfurimicrobium sp. TaxID=2022436 RepID=UPI004048EC05